MAQRLQVNFMNEQHVSIIPLMGLSPISHMGHFFDLGAKLKTLPGQKFVGVSSKNNIFDDDGEQRIYIIKRQWGEFIDGSINFESCNSAGVTVAKAFDSLNPESRKILHILVGTDRFVFGKRLKRSIEEGKLKELKGSFDEILLHSPENSDRSHGLSGTRMRNCALQRDFLGFAEHVGACFFDFERWEYMGKIKLAIESGQIKVKRPK